MNKIKPQRVDCGSPNRSQKHSETTPAGTIAAAIIVASVILIGGWIGYQEYKEWETEQQAIEILNQFTKEAKAITEQARKESETYNIERRKREIQKKLNTEKGIDELREKQLAKTKAKKQARRVSLLEQKAYRERHSRE